jgi:hypothetical protein
MTALKKATKITLRYDGKNTDNHHMDAFKLADAVKGMASSIQQANKLINGEGSEVEVDVVVFQDGCFGTVFEISQSTVEIFDVLKVLGLIGTAVAADAGRKGILKLVELIGTNKIKSSEIIGEQTKIILSDETEILTDNESAVVVLDDSVRKGLSDVFYEPMASGEATSVSLGKPIEGENAEKMDVLFTITADVARKYQKPATLTKADKTTREVTKDIRFSRINFKAITGWSILLPDGEEVTGVKIKDTAFFDRVKADSEKFSSEQLFKCVLEEITSDNMGVKSVKYNVKQVLRHRAAAENKLVPDS